MLLNKRIIIAFDGPDNVGKGTQIARLRKWLSHIPFVLTNLDRPHGENHEQKLRYGFAASRNHLLAKKAMWEEGLPQLVDRMHYTEYAYSILRKGHALDDILALEQDFLAMRDDFFTIIFLDDVKNIMHRDDGKSVYRKDDEENIKRICQRFEKIAEHSHFSNAVVSIQGKSIDEVEREVQELIRKRFPDIVSEV